MSIISAFQPFTSIHKQNHPQIAHKTHPSSIVQCPKNALSTHKFPHFKVTQMSKLRRVRSVEEETQVSEQTVGAEEAEAPAEKPAPVPVSPSDKLIMFFQADGTMSEAAAPAVRQALEATEGISDLKVQISEGICSVELTKETTIQATGVASGLVEIIQGAGFKLQTLNLSFADEEL
ncbi:hypothetical protein Cgig2_027851 [Carnegiea gigantea]|uniref:HMA domain-containing protein n=1 Tax=Carnegiea gigantea TaxID=171969 RepID=A0A9Q1GKT9_9CARY|nr:hypothetical protein Cgig2_027851 [Carnegiea gigantea]